jgi:hypothetical protein
MKKIKEMKITKIVFTAYYSSDSPEDGDDPQAAIFEIEGEDLFKSDSNPFGFGGLPTGVLGLFNDLYVVTEKMGDLYDYDDIIMDMDDGEGNPYQYKVSGDTDFDQVKGIRDIKLYEEQEGLQFSNLLYILKEFGLQDDEGTGIGTVVNIQL